MSRLAIVAHFDPRGEVAPHVLRQLDQLTSAFDRVILVSPCALTERAVADVRERCELILRQNFGHDFGSWRDALEQVDWAQDYDELLLTNDSYAGFFRPIGQIIEEMSRRPVEVWGITKCWRHDEHIQSYFLYFQREALHSAAFRRFWEDAKPARDRFEAIFLQEIGVSRAMKAAGFALGSFFVPTDAEALRANRRGAHWLRSRQRAFPAKFHNISDEFFSPRRARDPREARFLNTSRAFGDSTLDDGRLPLIKFDTLRYDPYWLGSDELLTDLEKRYPVLMQGVRSFIAETASFYRARPFENGAPVVLNPLLKATVGYTTREPRGHRGARS